MQLINVIGRLRRAPQPAKLSKVEAKMKPMSNPRAEKATRQDSMIQTAMTDYRIRKGGFSSRKITTSPANSTMHKRSEMASLSEGG